MQKWEYTTLQLVMNDKENMVWQDAVEDNRSVSERLNEFGANGWELVGVDSRSLSGITISTVYYLKRPAGE
jgi:hypothetical protein